MRGDVRHYTGPGRVAHWLPVLLVLALLGGSAAAYRYDLGPRYLPWLSADPETEPAAVAPPPGLDLPEWTAPVIAPALPTTGRIDPVAVAAALGPLLDDPDLGKHVVAAVGDLTFGSEWTSVEGPDTYLPASTTKLLTVAAALEHLGPEARFTTRVVSGTSPREVVLVGGGDPYLASKPLTPDEAATAFPPRVDVVTLAREAAEALGGSGRVRVRYDDGLFTGPTASAGWRSDYVPDDIVSPITALMVDGGREADGYARADDPSLQAARAFADALAAAGLKVRGKVERVVVPPDAAELAAVVSARLGDIAERVLDVSDNEGAEVLGHHVGLATSGTGSFAAGAAGVGTTLQGWGIDTSGLRLYDGSGLSRQNRVSAATVLAVLRRVAGSEGGPLRSAVTGLPVAAFTGSLTYRFDEGPKAARGVVRAKTGTLTGVHALAGLATGRDGVVMAFVVAADKVGEADGLDAQEAVDQAAAALAACRCAASG